MSHTFVPMTDEDAHAIAEWSYEEPYSFYDMENDPADRALFLDESRLAGRPFAVFDDEGLVGFFTFDVDGGTVTIGLGMEPRQTGEGNGAEFVQSGLDFARERYAVEEFRLAVATFNERAIRVYESLGFERREEFVQATNGGQHDFVAMSRPVE